VDPPPPSSRSAAGDHTDRAAAATSANTAEVGVLTAVWCCSVGATWTLELRELDHGRPFGAIVDWISSGVPVSQPAPEALAHELLAARGLRLFSDSPADPSISSRYRIGYVCPDTELITVADNAEGSTAPPGANDAPPSRRSDAARSAAPGSSRSPRRL
jgi:hypothetical protein